MSEPDWYRTLNGRVFLALPASARLEKLRNAPPYKQREHDILTVDTESLVDAYAEKIEPCHVNSGAVHPPRTIRAAPVASSRSPATHGSIGLATAPASRSSS